MKINCDYCGIEFNRRPSEMKRKNYCCKECRSADKRTKCICGTCGKEFEKLKSELSKTNFCNMVCSTKFTSARMTVMNLEMNPTRMVLSTRLKLRQSRLREGFKPKSYLKFLGKHVHRIVAADKLNRPLRKGEIVHHKDENIHNNHPDNLEVLSSQSEHARIHMINRWRNN